MYDFPICRMCGEYEVGTFGAHMDFCSDYCANKAHDYDATDDGAWELEQDLLLTEDLLLQDEA